MTSLEINFPQNLTDLGKIWQFLRILTEIRNAISDFVSVNRIYSLRAETMVGGLPRAFRFGIFDGFHEISDLTPVMGPPFSGIIINAHVRVLNA